MPRSEEGERCNKKTARGVTFSVRRAGFSIRHFRVGQRSVSLEGRLNRVARGLVPAFAPLIGGGPPSGSETTCADDLVASSGREDLPDVKPRLRGELEQAAHSRG